MNMSEDNITGAPDTKDEHQDIINILDEIIEERLYKFLGGGRIRNKKAESSHPIYEADRASDQS
jgi:hypothetical protein